jgi:hypothetical protein
MKVKNIRILLINTMLFALVTAAQAQLGVNLTGSPPNASAMLDVSATDKGLLLPRVALTGATDVTTISSPARSLIVFNTAVAGTPPNDVVKGVYYWDSSNSRWKVLGGNMNHYIGEKYCGGKVFYIFDGGMHGLIADTVDLSTGINWRNATNAFTYAVRDGFYAGQYNTDRIITRLGAGSYAATTCANYKGGGFSDWYLPSLYELNLLYIQKAVVGGFSNTVYWSSKDYNLSTAYGQDFNSGSTATYTKTTNRYVRAIRAF